MKKKISQLENRITARFHKSLKKKVGHNDKKKEKDRFLSTTRKFSI